MLQIVLHREEPEDEARLGAGCKHSHIVKISGKLAFMCWREHCLGQYCSYMPSFSLGSIRQHIHIILNVLAQITP